MAMGRPEVGGNVKIEFFVRTQPIPKQSYRHSSKGGYQPARVKNWEEIVGWTARNAMIGKDMLKGDLLVRLDFRRKDKRRVDLDNLCKGVTDSLQGIVFVDDSQIVELHATKLHDPDAPGVLVSVEQINA